MTVGKPVIFDADGSTNHRAYAEQRKVTAGDQLPVEGWLEAAIHAYIQTHGGIGSYVRNRLVVTQGTILFKRHAFTGDPKSRGILHRQHPPHHSVDQAEDCGIRADSERDGECRN